MMINYTNTQVYVFLAEECKQHGLSMEQFASKIENKTDDSAFWELLSTKLDCFRVCDGCGKPIIEGYVVDDCTVYCSKKCLYDHVTQEEYEELCSDESENYYYTTWYEDSLTFKKLRNDSKTVC